MLFCWGQFLLLFSELYNQCHPSLSFSCWLWEWAHYLLHRWNIITSANGCKQLPLSLSPFPPLTCCLSHLHFNLSLPLAPSHSFCPFLCWFASTGIDLENIVYYKDDTHYFVMTAKKQSLLEKGVILHVSDQRVWLLPVFILISTLLFSLFPHSLSQSLPVCLSMSLRKVLAHLYSRHMIWFM